MANRIFIVYSMVIAIGLGTALGSGWKFNTPQFNTGSGSGYRGSSGSWGWGGGK